MTRLSEIQFFNSIKESENILLAGAGGGFDIYSGLPVYFALKQMGKNVTLANFSFTELRKTSATEVFPFCYQVEASCKVLSSNNYFPEKYLCEWLLTRGEQTSIYAFAKTGVLPLKKAYDYIIKKHSIDTIVLVDGGTDSLMFGDEDGLGTPVEDICSMAAVYKTSIKKKHLLSVGFGIDHFHGVSHFRFLENVAELMRDGGYNGMFQVTKEMEEGKHYIAAVEYANMRMKGMESIVNNSISSAVQGYFGNHQVTERTKSSELWINPLMSIYWCFELDAVIQKNKYYPRIKATKNLFEINSEIAAFQLELKSNRAKKNLLL
ncbi:DUF1152 domain-containing protein [Chondrinema litorale]|uniref:DUF1152 domain-containing protein n=1 Tax=Chondrinema litorale TaxID=2994555 RepID=UPI0025427257|nr:DUF1152 domain-containing protein [Chondrinema litorale]UZR98810.1 DUF1152 domain-containing protein [Chondrinema litorale]